MPIASQTKQINLRKREKEMIKANEKSQIRKTGMLEAKNIMHERGRLRMSLEIFVSFVSHT